MLFDAGFFLMFLEPLEPKDVERVTRFLSKGPEDFLGKAGCMIPRLLSTERGSEPKTSTTPHMRLVCLLDGPIVCDAV